MIGRAPFLCACVLAASCAAIAEEGSEPARIVVHTGRAGRAVRRTLFGANICWPMYTNNLDPKRHTGRDFLALAPLAKQLGLTMLRYPGGLWSDAHRWKRGIGPMAQRQGGSPNGIGDGQLPIIGTDEFLRFCEAAGMEGIITVNYGLSQIESPEVAYQEAADWVEYCNAPNNGSNPGAGRDWAAVRAKNGHPEPYRVRYWEIGNEIYALDQPDRRKWGHTDVATYATRCVAFARAMKAIDPAIKVGAVAHTKPGFVSHNDAAVGSDKPWNRTILEIAGQHIDFLIPHLYSSGPGGKIGFLASNGVLGGEYVARVSGDHTIVAKVGGDRFKGAWSRFQLRVDGEAVAELDTKSKNPRPFTHNAHLDAGKHTIDVRFINDLWVKGEGDRNLRLGGISVRGPDRVETQVHLIDPQDRVSLCTAVVEADREKLRSMREMIRQIIPDRANAFELAVTEWNEGGEVGTLSTALHCAAKMATMAEEGVESAQYWLLFNAVQYRRTEMWFPAGQVRLPRPPAYVMQIFTRHCQPRVVECDAASPELPPLKQARKGWPPLGQCLRVLATASDEARQIGLIVINRNVTNPIRCRVSWTDFTAAARADLTCLTGPDPYDRNTGCRSMDDLRVKAVRRTVTVQPHGFVHDFPPMSVTGLTLAAQ